VFKQHAVRNIHRLIWTPYRLWQWSPGQLRAHALRPHWSDVMKRNLKQWWSTNSTNINKTKYHLSFHIIEHKKSTTYNVGNPGHGLEQTQTCGGVKPVNRIPSLSSYLKNYISYGNTDIKKQWKWTFTYSLLLKKYYHNEGMTT
jgi:hypothetical protein